MFSGNLIRRILVEGNIAVGKSTIMSHLKSSYPSNIVRIHHEPVENWTNINGFDLLKALYTESNRWTFAFEMSALLSRIKYYTNNISNQSINVYERSILSCFHVFIRHGFHEKHLTEAEYEVLQSHFQYGLERTLDLSQTIIIYFDLSPQQSFQRIIKRSRPSELNIDLKRIQNLKYYYDEFIRNFKSCPVKVIDASQSIEEVCGEVHSLLSQCIKQNQSIYNAQTSNSSITKR